MIIPPVGGLAGELSLAQSGLAQGAQSGLAQGAQGAQGAQSAAEALPSGGAEATGEGGFSSELSEAIGSLEKTQQSADSASRALATGTVKDPESAVVTVEDAQLAMQLAAQIRTKATEAAQTIFQTQV